MANATCTINGQSTADGYNCSPGELITVQLADLAGVNSWSLTCVGTDDFQVKESITASIIIDNVLKRATMVVPSTISGCALILKSVVNNGRTINGTLDPNSSTQFGIFSIGTGLVRLLASGQTTEGSATFGWIKDINGPFRKSLIAYNVKGFGAVGDGIANDTAAIKDALATALSKGYSLEIPAGTYIVRETLFIDSTIQIFGTGKIIFDFGYAPVNGQLFYITADRVSISGITIDATTVTSVSNLNTVNKYAIFALGSSNTHLSGLHIDGVTFTNLNAGNTAPPGVIATHAIYARYVDDPLIENCHFDTIQGSAIFFSFLERPTIIHNTIKDTAWYSIELQQAVSGANVSNNFIVGDRHGIRYWGASINMMSDGSLNDRAVVKGNYISGVHSYGTCIDCESMHNADIEGNIFDQPVQKNLSDSFTHVRIDSRSYSPPSTNFGPSSNINVRGNFMIAGGPRQLGVYADCQDGGTGSVARSTGLIVANNQMVGPRASNGAPMAPVIASNSGGPTITVTGTPISDVSRVIIQITTTGGLAAGAFKWSTDDGYSYTTGRTINSTVTLGSSGITAHFSSGTYTLNDTYSSLATYFTAGVSMHGQQGGISYVLISGNQIEGLPLGSPVDGLIGSSAFNSSKNITDLIVVNNILRMIGAATDSVHMGMWFGQYTERALVDGNILSGFRYGIRTDGYVTGLTLGLTNQFNNNFADYNFSSLPAPLYIPTNNFAFLKTTTPNIYHDTDTDDGVLGKTLTIHAQNATGVGTAGGQLTLASGTGTGHAGDVVIQTGATTRLTVSPTEITAALSLLLQGSNRATTGDIRAANGTTIIGARNSTNDGNIPVLATSSNIVVVGDTTQTGAIQLQSSGTISVVGTVVLFRDSPGFGTAFTLTPNSTGITTLQFESTVTSAVLKQATVSTNSATGATLTIQAQIASGTTSVGGDLVLSPGTGTSSNGNLNLNNLSTTTTAPSPGAGDALPATPTGYATIKINGTSRKVAYY